MKARPLRTRTDLLALIRRHAPSRACARSIGDGRVIVLGGFTPPGGFPRWIVHVQSPHGRDWYAHVICDESRYQYRVQWSYEDDVPWAHWDGQSDGRHPLRDGDTPETVAFKQKEAQHATG